MKATVPNGNGRRSRYLEVLVGFQGLELLDQPSIGGNDVSSGCGKSAHQVPGPAIRAIHGWLYLIGAARQGHDGRPAFRRTHAAAKRPIDVLIGKAIAANQNRIRFVHVPHE
jgi:hypothetical protein